MMMQFGVAELASAGAAADNVAADAAAISYYKRERTAQTGVNGIKFCKRE